MFVFGVYGDFEKGSEQLQVAMDKNQLLLKILCSNS